MNINIRLWIIENGMSAFTEEDALKVLEIQKGASLKDINDAFRRKALKAHPDAGGSSIEFQKLQSAKDKLVSINGQEARIVAQKVENFIDQQENVSGFITIDDAFLVNDNENEFRAWRQPNMKVMTRLTANNRNKETEMIIDYCKKGYGGSTQAVEAYLRNEAGITSPYHMNSRVIAIRTILENFRKYHQSK